MLESSEIFACILIAFLLFVPFRRFFFQHFKTILGFGIGMLAGRIFYFYLARFFGFESLLVKIVVVIIFGFLFLEAFRDIVRKVSQK